MADGNGGSVSCVSMLWLGFVFMVKLCVSVADEQISMKVDESGWAWMVCGETLIIWKISQTAVAKVNVSSSHQRINSFACWVQMSRTTVEPRIITPALLKAPGRDRR